MKNLDKYRTVFLDLLIGVVITLLLSAVVYYIISPVNY
jgi:hypothetical protein